MTTDGRMRASLHPALALRVLTAVCASFSLCATLVAAPPGSPAHADLSGVWQADMPFDFVDPAKDEIPLTPAYAKKLKDWRAAADGGRPLADSVARCEAFGMPRIMSFGLME